MASFSTLTIEEATERLIDYRGKTPPKTNAGIRLVTAKVVKGGQIQDQPAEFIAADFYDEWMRRGLPQQLDVLLTTEAPLGEVAIIRGDARIALAQRIILLRAKPNVLDAEYLFYALQSEFGQEELKARASGTTVLGIKQSELRKVRIPVPPLPTQQRIANILSAYDELIENSQQRIKILEAMASSIYREWFVYFRFPGHESVPLVPSSNGEIPQNWDSVKLGTQLVALESGRRPKGGIREIDGGVPSIGAENINGIGRHDFAGEKFIPREFFSEMRSGVVQDRDVAIYKDGAYIGKSSYFRDGFPHFECSVNEHVFLLRSTGERLKQNAMYLWLQESDTVQLIRSKNANAAQPGINQETVRGLDLIVPDSRTAEQFDKLIDPFLAEIIVISTKVYNLRRTRDLLLPRLLSGQIEVSGDHQTGAL